MVGHDIWFCIRPNLGLSLVTSGSLLTRSEVPKFPKFCYYISGSPVFVVSASNISSIDCYAVSFLTDNFISNLP